VSHKVVPIPFKSSLIKSCRSSHWRTQVVSRPLVKRGGLIDSWARIALPPTPPSGPLSLTLELALQRFPHFLQVGKETQETQHQSELPPRDGQPACPDSRNSLPSKRTHYCERDGTSGTRADRSTRAPDTISRLPILVDTCLPNAGLKLSISTFAGLRKNVRTALSPNAGSKQKATSL
jgi:hypothetical protein